MFVPVAYLVLIVYLVVVTLSPSVPDLKGGDAAALVGGIALVTMFGAAFARNRSTFLETSAEHIVDGLVFAFEAMGVVLPIAGQSHLPTSGLVTAFGILIVAWSRASRAPASPACR